ncbi:hypothetical protein B4N89_27345 [Embleya scabrispora]|uniref:Uncharacterized protein n=1 Tax=Embleya scabrispora TaxID=159449 RepID=A0A1T3P4W7_9ACTN|nr:hypothetical protein [Embleya scabrispora]OPC84147.1 hypothetical protein B4N89_27345 [Embleya scabrispora]
MNECPTPDKARFATLEAAQSFAIRKFLSLGIMLRPYGDCSCEWYHLTSQGSDELTPTETELAREYARLRDLDPPAFVTLVRDDALGRTSKSTAAALRTPGLLERWRAALKELKTDIHAQIEQSRAQEHPGSRDWRNRIAHLQRRLAVRSAETNSLAVAFSTQGTPATSDAEPSRATCGERAVERLVAAHRAEFDRLVHEEYTAAGLSIPQNLLRRDTFLLDATPRTEAAS